MKIIHLSLLWFLLLAALSGQSGIRSSRDMKTTNIEQFTLTLIPKAAEDTGHIYLDVYIMIPSFALQFIKENDAFQSKFEAQISLLDEDGNQVDSEIFTNTLTAADYLETISRSNWYFIEHEFLVEPKEYTVVGEVMDKDTRNSGTHEKKIDLRKYDAELKLFPPVIMTILKGTWQGGGKTMPSYRNEISFQQSKIPVHLSGKILPGDYSLHIKLEDSSGEFLSEIDTTLATDTHFFYEKFELYLEEIHGLRVKLIVDLKQNGKTDRQSIELKINRPGISSRVRDLEEALDQMRYILDNDERSALSKAKKKDKEGLFYSFWRDRDPTPETNGNELMDQYYSRVHYANEHFTSFTSGWKTDMGMIYILFGPPDDIERTFMSSNRNARHTWHYYRINRSFTFYDENGFGDFRLTTPYLFGRAW